MKRVLLVPLFFLCTALVISCTKPPAPSSSSDTVVGEKAAPSKPTAGKPGGPPAPGPACGDCDAVTPAEPVILVHGRNDTSARWDTLVADFTSRGYTEGQNLFRIDMTTFCGDNGWCSDLAGYSAPSVNESYAKCLQAYIQSVAPCQEGACPSVDLVAHSQGSIAVRFYSRFLAPAEGRTVSDMVLMSGPEQGIINCGLAGSCTGVNPEDCPDSPLMHQINGVSPEGDGSNDETPAGPGYSVVVSDRDNVISPWCSGHLITGPDQMQADDMDCRRTNYTVDPDESVCTISAAHLVIPADASAVRFAYCKIND